MLLITILSFILLPGILVMSMLWLKKTRSGVGSRGVDCWEILAEALEAEIGKEKADKIRLQKTMAGLFSLVTRWVKEDENRWAGLLNIRLFYHVVASDHPDNHVSLDWFDGALDVHIGGIMSCKAKFCRLYDMKFDCRDVADAVYVTAASGTRGGKSRERKSVKYLADQRAAEWAAGRSQIRLWTIHGAEGLVLSKEAARKLSPVSYAVPTTGQPNYDYFESAASTTGWTFMQALTYSFVMTNGPSEKSDPDRSYFRLEGVVSGTDPIYMTFPSHTVMSNASIWHGIGHQYRRWAARAAEKKILAGCTTVANILHSNEFDIFTPMPIESGVPGTKVMVRPIEFTSAGSLVMWLETGTATSVAEGPLDSWRDDFRYITNLAIAQGKHNRANNVRVAVKLDPAKLKFFSKSGAYLKAKP